MNGTIHVISLGCSKNLVDSERLMAMLSNSGAKVRHNSSRHSVRAEDAAIINTCGFIGDAKEESIDEILAWAQLKSKGKLRALYVMGCLSERYRQELEQEIPEVDHFYGKTDWKALTKDLLSISPGSVPYDRIITTPRHHAYIKISEGCDRHCAFCAIPLITGRHRSRPIEEIIAEVELLVGRGVKEFNVIAQELTSYGKDLYGAPKIAQLVDEMAQLNGVELIRLHYAYPTGFPLELLDVMARHDNVAKYLDIALQHISDRVLERMNRHITGQETRQLLREMRRRVPGLHLRTTLMVGFPGETEQDFEQLMQFVSEERFERMGAFAYCEEDDTPAQKLYPDDVPAEVKQSRLDQLMELQQQISLEIQQQKVGQTLPVIIDRKERDHYIGRTQWDSPEVDPEVIVDPCGGELKRGHFYDVLITEAFPYELAGKVVR